MADPRARHETVVFNRGGEQDIDWLNENYPQLSVNLGVGHESFFVLAPDNLLVEIVRARPIPDSSWEE